MIYAEQSDYEALYGSAPDDFAQLARKASHSIDILTYNRIAAAGFEHLTDYQRTTITECCCEMVKFYSDNAGMLDMPMSSYSINGVSMQFGLNPTVYSRSGLILPQTAYGMLMSTGLCFGGLK